MIAARERVRTAVVHREIRDDDPETKAPKRINQKCSDATTVREGHRRAGRCQKRLSDSAEDGRPRCLKLPDGLLLQVPRADDEDRRIDSTAPGQLPGH